MRRRSRRPSSGKSAMSVHAVTGPMPGDRAQQIVGFPPGRGRAHQGREIGIEAAEGLVEPGDMGIEVALQATITQQAAAVLLGAEHVDQLAATGDQFAQGARLFIGHRARARGGRLRQTAR